MRDILLCATTFSLIITVLTFLVSGQQNLIEIDHKAFRLMECDPLIDMDGNEIKAPEDCVFRRKLSSPKAQTCGEMRHRYQAIRKTITPLKIIKRMPALNHVIFSFKNRTPSATANRTEVSRSDDTTATGADRQAQSTAT